MGSGIVLDLSLRRLHMLRIIFGFLGMSGFILIFGGVSMVDSAHDVYGMGIGFAVSLIGLLSFAVFAFATCEERESDKLP